MSKVLKTSIVASFIGLWLTSFITAEYQNYLGFLLIFSFGILHGANDLVLIRQFKTSKKRSFIKILLNYLLIVFISASFFIMIPFIVLIFFIIVSAYHFGEQHWSLILNNTNKTISRLFQFSYGMVILFLLFEINQKEVIEIVYQISNVLIPAQLIIYLLLSFLFLMICLSYYIFTKSETFKNNLIEQILYLIVFVIIFNVASLIWGFAIYFIFWHSIPSLHDQIKFLYGTSNFSNLLKYIKSAFIYWILSLFGIGILYYLLKETHYFNALFFSFLASITFPHSIIILKMFQKEEV